MTTFIGVSDMVRWITNSDVPRILVGLMERIEQDYRRWNSFDKTPRVASHTPFGVIELMPTSDHEIYAFKYVNGHPSNPARGYQTVTAFGVLADVHNGYPRFLAEMTLLTALRTAATSAMAARLLARPDSTTMAMIGTGSQAEFQALAMRAVLEINTLHVWDTDPDALAKFVRNMRPHGFDITVASNSGETLEAADIITTCTAEKSHISVLPPEALRPGTHINTIGGDCPGKTELDPRVLHLSDIFVEYSPQTRIEGEIQQLDPTHPVTEIASVLAGQEPGRTSPEQITLFDSVGFAIEDFSALCYLRDDVAGTDHEKYIDLVADPEDPKDLFGMLGSLSPVG